MTLPWAEAVALLTQADEVLLACHVGPDGDALGALLGLGLGLARRGARVTCSWGEEPTVVPEVYAHLPGQELLVPPSQAPAAPPLLVTLDCSSADRLGSLADRVATAGRVLVVDHHGSGAAFGDVRLVDPGAAATVVLVTELLDRLGVPLDVELATCLYTGLVTDTGSFRHASTSPQVHALAARLVAAGVRPDEVARRVWECAPFGYLQVLGAACGRAVLDTEALGGRGLVWTLVRAADLAGAGLGLADVEGIIDVLRTAREAEVAVVLKEGPDGRLRVSTRSRGGVDVGAACAALGGGGHRFAAGFTSAEDAAATLTRLQAALQ